MADNISKTFYLTLDINVQVKVPIQADNLEDAMEKTKKENYELPDLNDSYISKTCMKYIQDENYNVVHIYGRSI